MDAKVRDVAAAPVGRRGDRAVSASLLLIQRLSLVILDLGVKLALQHRQLAKDGVKLLILAVVEVDERAAVLLFPLPGTALGILWPQHWSRGDQLASTVADTCLQALGISQSVK